LASWDIIEVNYLTMVLLNNSYNRKKKGEARKLSLLET